MELMLMKKTSTVGNKKEKRKLTSEEFVTQWHNWYKEFVKAANE